MNSNASYKDIFLRTLTLFLQKEIKCNEKILCEWDSGNEEIRHKHLLYRVEHWRANNRATIVLHTTNNTHRSTYLHM